jgi:hypothetical protein
MPAYRGAQDKSQDEGGTTPPADPGGGSSNGTTGSETGGNQGNKDRIVVQIPVNTAAGSSTLAERKVDDLLRSAFRGKVPGNTLELKSKLDQMVQAKKVEGRAKPEFQFSPTPLSGGSSGTISGQSVAQISLAERAQAALADAEKRLAALKPMQAPSDPENLDALRAVTLAIYKRLVSELADGGELIATRIDKYFFVLIADPKPDPFNLNGGLLKDIQDNFKIGTVGSVVNTLEDSANLTNFRIVKENLFDIYRSWLAFKDEVKNDFSELSGKLSRELTMIENELTDVETAMDLVGHDETDREGDIIKSDETPAQELTANGLFSWIREFTAEEGPELIEQGGMIGIKASLTTLEQLQNLVNKLETRPPVDDISVKASLTSVRKHFDEAVRLAKQITGTT